MGCVSVHLLRMLRMFNSRTQARLIFILFYRMERVYFLSWYFYVASEKKTIFRILSIYVYVWEYSYVHLCPLMVLFHFAHIQWRRWKIFEMEKSLKIVGHGIWVNSPSLSLFLSALYTATPCNAEYIYNIYNGTYFYLKGMPEIQLCFAHYAASMFSFPFYTGAKLLFFSIPKESVKSMTHLNPFRFVMAKVILS